MQTSTNLSTKALIKYIIISIIFAGVILLTLILPAEYNIDPTGIGGQLGLTVLSPDKTENLEDTSIAKSTNTLESLEVIVPARSGVEYKFNMTQYQKLEYEWITDGEVLYFDLHGEPEGDTTGYFESYAIASVDEMKGSFTAPFTGSHGWYWKNTTDAPVTVLLMAKGEYKDHGLK